MLTDKEIRRLVKKISKGAKYLEEYDNFGAVFPDRKKHATFTLHPATIKKLKEIDNKSDFVEKAINDAFRRKEANA